ncbi:MAG: AMP-binding protein [Bacteroidetes bacterium]|nr:AMP-binding protein [Bacteroidota bacterium]
MNILKSDIEPGNTIANIALMLEKNVKRFPDRIVCSEMRNGKFEGITWKTFYRDIQNIIFNLRALGFGKQDKMIVYSANRMEMLELELAVMAMGAISVPIFSYFNKETATLLINHSDAKFMAVSGKLHLHRIDTSLKLQRIIVFDDNTEERFNNQISFRSLVKESGEEKNQLDFEISPDDICLNMYTFGTMGIPKCVQLTHGNVLSQQAALEKLWGLTENDRFLSYLPWHHGFGGIFERFSALYNGATIYLESSHGRDPKTILENWKLVKPTLFFSIPKVYELLMDLVKGDAELEKSFFHDDLKFVFTAAASLPKNVSDEFEKRNIAVIEGWGLTETSPCCTLTDPKLKREEGVVGMPIPGVSIRLAADNEIQVKGPNVMKGYCKNDEANKNSFTEDGWFCTGDIGEFTPSGLKLISRKESGLKTENGEKVVPHNWEYVVQDHCHYISFALVVGNGEEYPLALLFPNKKMLDHPHYELSPEEGCFCPRSVDELRKCLKGCLHESHCGIGQKFSQINSFLILEI